MQVTQHGSCDTTHKLLMEEYSSLRDERKNLRLLVIDLKETIANLETENLSLITLIRLLQ